MEPPYVTPTHELSSTAMYLGEAILMHAVSLGEVILMHDRVDVFCGIDIWWLSRLGSRQSGASSKLAGHRQ